MTPCILVGWYHISGEACSLSIHSRRCHIHSYSVPLFPDIILILITSTLKIKAVFSSETLLLTYKTTWCYNTEYLTLDNFTYFTFIRTVTIYFFKIVFKLFLFLFVLPSNPLPSTIATNISCAICVYLTLNKFLTPISFDLNVQIFQEFAEGCQEEADEHRI